MANKSSRESWLWLAQIRRRRHTRRAQDGMAVSKSILSRASQVENLCHSHIDTDSGPSGLRERPLSHIDFLKTLRLRSKALVFGRKTFVRGRKLLSKVENAPRRRRPLNSKSSKSWLEPLSQTAPLGKPDETQSARLSRAPCPESGQQLSATRSAPNLRGESQRSKANCC